MDMTQTKKAYIHGAQPYCPCRPSTALVEEGRVVCAFCHTIYTPVSFETTLEIPLSQPDALHS